MYPGAYLDTAAHKPAVIMADTGRTVTFAELEANSIRIARHLRALGLCRGDHVAVLATNTPRVFDIYWAAMRSGLYVTMVNWHLTPRRGRVHRRRLRREGRDRGRRAHGDRR